MSAVRVACHQLAPVVGDLDGNRERALAAIRAAAAAGAGVVVLPELVASGDAFRDAEEARALAEPPDGPTLAGWARAAREHSLVVTGGCAELGADGRIHNSAAIVDASGIRGVYRKVHLWDRESLEFAPGDEPPLVLDTQHGR